MTRRPRLTRAELVATLEAIGERLAGEIDADTDDAAEDTRAALGRALGKLAAQLDHRRRPLRQSP